MQMEAMNGDNEENGFRLIKFFPLFPKYHEKNYFNFSKIIWSEKVNKLIQGTKLGNLGISGKNPHNFVPPSF